MTTFAYILFALHYITFILFIYLHYNSPFTVIAIIKCIFD